MMFVMSRRRAAVLSWAVSLALSLAAGSAHAAPIVACIGEQSTHSLHKTFPVEYPAKLQKLLGSAYTVCNWGRYRGAVTTTAMGGTAGPYIKTQEYQCSLGKCPAGFAYKGQCNSPTLPAGPPSYVLLGPWGKADTMESRTPLTQEQVEKDLRALAESYLALPNRPKVILVYPFPVPYPKDGNPSGPVTNVLLPAFKNVAAAMNLPVVDLYAYFSKHVNELQSDHDGHLTAEVGIPRHADMVAAAIRAAGPSPGHAADAGPSSAGDAMVADVRGEETSRPADERDAAVSTTGGDAAAPVVMVPPPRAPTPQRDASSSQGPRQSSGCRFGGNREGPLWMTILALALGRGWRRKQAP
jgi:hypothetical protein